MEWLKVKILHSNSSTAKKKKRGLGVVVHRYNPSTQEGKIGDPKFHPVQPGLH
jgi:hypothetical protein